LMVKVLLISALRVANSTNSLINGTASDS